jgi:hypothetical protein
MIGEARGRLEAVEELDGQRRGAGEGELSEEMSAFTGRCISAEMAVGTVMRKVALCRSIELPEVVHHALAPVALRRGQTICAPEASEAPRQTTAAKTWNIGKGQIIVSRSVNRSGAPPSRCR